MTGLASWTAEGYTAEEAAEWIAAGVRSWYAAWEWRLRGHTAAEVAEWRRAGVLTPAHVDDWVRGGLGPEDVAAVVPLVRGQQMEWMLAGTAIAWPERVPEDVDPGIWPSAMPARVYAAARSVWRARGGGPEPLDRRAVVAELEHSHPEHPPAVWLAALHRADLEAIMLRDCHLPLISHLRRAPAR